MSIKSSENHNKNTFDIQIKRRKRGPKNFIRMGHIYTPIKSLLDNRTQTDPESNKGKA